jgi:hypothetical protein
MAGINGPHRDGEPAGDVLLLDHRFSPRHQIVLDPGARDLEGLIVRGASSMASELMRFRTRSTCPAVFRWIPPAHRPKGRWWVREAATSG